MSIKAEEGQMFLQKNNTQQ